MRAPECIPLQLSRHLERRVADAEGVADVRHWLQLLGKFLTLRDGPQIHGVKHVAEHGFKSQHLFAWNMLCIQYDNLILYVVIAGLGVRRSTVHSVTTHAFLMSSTGSADRIF